MPDKIGQDDPLARCVERIRQDPDLPALSDNIRAIAESSLYPNITLSSIVETLHRDVALAMRVLRSANSILFNQSERPVLSLNQAAMLLGADTLSQLAESSERVEDEPRKGSSLPELMSLSVLTGELAGELLRGLHASGAEEASVCGMLRNIGELLYSKHFPVSYAELLIASRGEMLLLRQACRDQLGFTFEELSAALMNAASIRGVAELAARGAPDSLLANRNNAGNQVAMAAGLASALVTAQYRCDPPETKRVMQGWNQVLATAFAMSEKQAHDVMQRSVDRLGFTLQPVSLTKQLQQAAEVITEARSEETVSKPAIGLISVFEAALLSGKEFPGDGLIEAALEAAIGDKHADRGAWFSSGDYPRLITNGLAGFDLRALMDTRKPPVSLAAIQRQDVILDLEKDLRFAKVPLVESLKPVGLLLLPVIVNRKSIGCFYFDRTTKAPPADPNYRALLKLRDLVAKALQSLAR